MSLSVVTVPPSTVSWLAVPEVNVVLIELIAIWARRGDPAGIKTSKAAAAAASRDRLGRPLPSDGALILSPHSAQSWLFEALTGVARVIEVIIAAIAASGIAEVYALLRMRSLIWSRVNPPAGLA